MTHQLDLGARSNHQNDMTVVIEAQRETNENLMDTHGSVQEQNLME